MIIFEEWPNKGWKLKKVVDGAEGVYYFVDSLRTQVVDQI